MKKILIMFLLLWSFGATADTDFEIVSVEYYETAFGGRSAKVEIKNTSSFGRIFGLEDFIGTTVDGQKVSAKKSKSLFGERIFGERIRIDGKDTIILMVDFENTKYPLTKIELK